MARGIKVSTDFFLDRRHIIKKVGEGRARGLRRAGAMVYRSSQKQFLTGRKKRATNVVIGRFDGKPLIERRTRSPNPERITTWPGQRSPKGFLKTMLAFAWDESSKTVVVGPRGSPWLARLQEKGGMIMQRLYLRYRGRAIPYQKALGIPNNHGRTKFKTAFVGTFISPMSRVSSFVATAMTRVVKVRPSGYMEKGLDRVRSKIPEQLRDQIRGP